MADEIKQHTISVLVENKFGALARIAGLDLDTLGQEVFSGSNADKSAEQLRAMKEAGFLNPYIGVESGDDAVLKAVRKGYTAAEARAQLEKLTEAGMPFIANFLNGIGGAGFGLSHARKTAELYEGISGRLGSTSDSVRCRSSCVACATRRFSSRTTSPFPSACAHACLNRSRSLSMAFNSSWTGFRRENCAGTGTQVPSCSRRER